MIPKALSAERVILVHIDFPGPQQNELAEFKQLALAAGAQINAVISGARAIPTPKYFVGTGKVEEICAAVAAEQADLVLFNHSLTPSQERNLERAVKCCVLDRTGLILDIFAQRARSFVGKLQVELAQLQHLSTRLIRGWTHLERQKGGIGLRGPGETQLESDRRMLNNRMKAIHKRLARVQQQRDLSRRARRRADLATVAIVGYTNAGKSSLFNTITGANLYAADQLFATLDPTLRRLALPGTSSVLVADTVGFIRNLPHDLVEAFHSTLEETRDAHLLLHVIDVADPNWRQNEIEVNKTLTQIGASHIAQIKVFNKIDLLPDCKADIKYNQDHKIDQVWLSVRENLGIDFLKNAIREQLYGDPINRRVRLSPEEGKLRAELYRLNAVISEHIDDDGYWCIDVNMAKSEYMRLFIGKKHKKISIKSCAEQ